MRTRLGARLRALWRWNRQEAELEDELRFHLSEEVDQGVEAGLTPEQAGVAARKSLGNVPLITNQVRDVWVWLWVQGLSLDFKLGLRMLVKYPGLTLVGGLAMAFGIWVGVAGFEVLTQMRDPRLPLDDGHRVVGILKWDTERGRRDPRMLHDYLTWRDELASVGELGAFRSVTRNLITEAGGEAVELAEISASALRVARVRPFLGRTLVEADEAPGASPVLLLGYDQWRARFAGDPDVVGRSVTLGRTQATVVGVMPKGFAFPVADDLWVPLRLNPLDYSRGEGPPIQVLGRLTPGVSLDAAQTELQSLAARAAARFPATDEHLQFRVMPYARSIFDITGETWIGATLVNIFLVMLLVLVCANVALLMFARATTREAEVAVRSALGASRGRIIAQLFVEALVLGGVGLVVGLTAARAGLKWFWTMYAADAAGRLPFWFGDTLTPTTVIYAAVLTLLAALIAGVLPALKVTGRGRQCRLQQASAGGVGLTFGGVWSGVIVAQVAATVVFPAAAFFMHLWLVAAQTSDAGFPAEEHLSARLELERDPTLDGSVGATGAETPDRIGSTYEELARRLASEPEVVGVAFTDRLPRTYHSQAWVEVDGAVAPPESAAGFRLGGATVGLGFFDVVGAPLLSGRGFDTADVESALGVVMVNQAFVDRVMQGRDPVGQRLRYARPPDVEAAPWEEIVGVVRNLGMVNGQTEADAGVYRLAAPGRLSPVHVSIHVRGEPRAFAARFRAVAAGVDPTLQIHDLLPLDEVGASLWLETQFMSRLLMLVSAVALLLSLAAIYAVMAFTVSRRMREIGVRLALGAPPRRLLVPIFSGPLTRVGLGIALGGLLVAALVPAMFGTLSTLQVGLIGVYAVVMLAVCLLACVVPTRRAMRVEPADVLRADG